MTTLADGELGGPVREYDGDGRVCFDGGYVCGARDGPGWLALPDGGTLRGIWVEVGAVTAVELGVCKPFCV